MGDMSQNASLFDSRLRYAWRIVLLCGLLCLTYFATIRIGLNFYPVGGFGDFIWPLTAAIGLAALFFWGYDLWPGILLGTFLIDTIIGAPPFVAAGIALGSTFEVLAGAFVLRGLLSLNPLFERVRDALGLIATGATVPILGATFGSASLVLGGIVRLSDVPQIWMAWWLSNVLAVLVLAPFLFRWIAKPFFTRTPRKIVEEAGAFVLLVLSESLAFFSPFAQLQQLPLVYIFIPLLWISLRTGIRGLTLANLVTALFTLSSTLSGHGLFPQGTVIENLFVGQIFVATVSIIFFVFTATVEERRQMQRSLEEHVDTLEHTVEKISSEDQAKSDFLSVLAHELRNPLAPIVSAIELAKINGVRPENAKYFEIIDVQVHIIERLLDDLLDTTRILHKKLKLQKDVVELQQILNNSLETVQPLMKERGHNLSVSLPKKSIWLYGDSVRLTQIFVNILTNAAKYTNNGGKISVVCRMEKSAARVQVADTGIGIEPRLLRKIFEPFVQLNESSMGVGLGLGLALTKQLAELHGGSVSVASEGEGKGSVFSVFLPVLQTAPLPIGVKSKRGADEHRQDVRRAGAIYDILVVDDNEVAAHVLQKLLEHDGHIVEVVHTGEGAIDYVREHRPEVLILDIGLPDIDGYEVAKRLREMSGPALLLIALSGYGQKEDKDKAIKAGFDYHLTKPASVKDIQELLQYAKPA
ncbi:MAG: MASE1 domain-containing protein [Minisyncoccia bacterium]